MGCRAPRRGAVRADAVRKVDAGFDPAAIVLSFADATGCDARRSPRPFAPHTATRF